MWPVFSWKNKTVNKLNLIRLKKNPPMMIRLDKDHMHMCYSLHFRPLAAGRCYCDSNTEANSAFQESRDGCFTSNDAISSSVLPLKVALAKESLTSR